MRIAHKKVPDDTDPKIFDISDYMGEEDPDTYLSSPMNPEDAKKQLGKHIFHNLGSSGLVKTSPRDNSQPLSEDKSKANNPYEIYLSNPLLLINHLTAPPSLDILKQSIAALWCMTQPFADHQFNQLDNIYTDMRKNQPSITNVKELIQKITQLDELPTHYREVYLKEIIEAPPTDGLWDDGRTDEGQLGLSYKELEEAMENENSKNREKYLKIRKLNLHKMESIPVCKIPK